MNFLPRTFAWLGRGPIVVQCVQYEAGGRHVAKAAQGFALEGAPRAQTVRRLKTIEGQVRGLQQMVDGGRYCIDILTQIAAVQEALRGVSRIVMRHHLEHCATAAIQSEDPEEMSRTYDEIMDVVFTYTK